MKLGCTFVGAAVSWALRNFAAQAVLAAVFNCRKHRQVYTLSSHVLSVR